MTQVIPAGFGEIDWIFMAEGDPDAYEVTCGVDLSDAGGDLVGAANNAFLIWADVILGGQWEGLSLDHVDLRVGQDGGPPLIVSSNESPQSGSETTGFLPQNNALLVQKTTALAGRSGRGRMFVPHYVKEAQVNNVGRITGGDLTGMQTNWGDFFTQLSNGGEPTPGPILTPVLLHSDALPDPLEPTPITSFRVSSTIATQRRRLR